MTPERLQEMIEQFPTRRVAVVGDFFLDKYLDTAPELAETSVETGKRAHQVVQIRRSPGAAGTAVNNLAALKAGTLHAIGATGDDGEGYDLRQALEQRGCRTDGLLQFPSFMTPTYLKPRDHAIPGLAGEHERYDTKNRKKTAEEIIGKVLESLDAVLPDVDAVIVADQVEEDDCGIVTSSLRQALSDRARSHPNVIFWADSRAHVHSFRNMIIKPNEFEALGHAHPVPGEEIALADLKAALPQLRAENGAPVCVTRGEFGILVSDPEVTSVPGVKLDGPVDPTGAGDSVTAGAVLALAVGATLPESALVGILTASITVQQLATTGTASPEELLERFDVWRAQNQSG